MRDESNKSEDASKMENVPEGLPKDIWIEIASQLSPQDLANFKLACKAFLAIGQADKISKPIYNQFYARLRKLDPSLPESLPRQNYDKEYQRHFVKVQSKFTEEYSYLIIHHRDFIALDEFNISTILKLPPLTYLEKFSAVLDKINTCIIKKYIKIQDKELYLSSKKITRLPEILIKDQELSNFWQGLRSINCEYNKLTTLNIQGLNALKHLNCNKNQLTTLNVQGLNALEHLNCNNNELPALNVQGLNKLKFLYCDNNRLELINLKDLHALEHLNCRGNQLTSLNVQGLNELISLSCSHNQLATLNAQGLNKLLVLDCSNNPITTLFAHMLTSLEFVWIENTKLTWATADPSEAARKLRSPKMREHHITTFYNETNSRNSHDKHKDNSTEKTTKPKHK